MATQLRASLGSGVVRWGGTDELHKHCQTRGIVAESLLAGDAYLPPAQRAPMSPEFRPNLRFVALTSISPRPTNLPAVRVYCDRQVCRGPLNRPQPFSSEADGW